MSEPFLAQIVMIGGNFAPRGWAFCDGQLLAISSNSALFSILGTTFGGDGRTTFGLPDLRGRTPMHRGNGFGHAAHTSIELLICHGLEPEIRGDDVRESGCFGHDLVGLPL